MQQMYEENLTIIRCYSKSIHVPVYRNWMVQLSATSASLLKEGMQKFFILTFH